VLRKHLVCLLIGWTLALLTAPEDAAGPGRSQTRLDTLPNEIALELGETGHDGAHELAASGPCGRSRQ